jgi:hypothetical protein
MSVLIGTCFGNTDVFVIALFILMFVALGVFGCVSVDSACLSLCVFVLLICDVGVCFVIVVVCDVDLMIAGVKFSSFVMCGIGFFIFVTYG